MFHFIGGRGKPDKKFQEALENITLPTENLPPPSETFVAKKMKPLNDSISYKEKYKQLVDELKIKLILTTKDDPDGWDYEQNPAAYVTTLAYVKDRNTLFTINLEFRSHYGHFVSFYCKDHKMHELSLEKTPAAGADSLFDAYTTIKSYVDDKIAEAAFSDKVDDLTAIMETF